MNDTDHWSARRKETYVTALLTDMRSSRAEWNLFQSRDRLYDAMQATDGAVILKTWLLGLIKLSETSGAYWRERRRSNPPPSRDQLPVGIGSQRHTRVTAKGPVVSRPRIMWRLLSLICVDGTSDLRCVCSSSCTVRRSSNFEMHTRSTRRLRRQAKLPRLQPSSLDG